MSAIYDQTRDQIPGPRRVPEPIPIPLEVWSRECTVTCQCGHSETFKVTVPEKSQRLAARFLDGLLIEAGWDIDPDLCPVCARKAANA